MSTAIDEREQLRIARAVGMPSSLRGIRHAKSLLYGARATQDLGDEIWALREQYAHDSLDFGDIKTANRELEVLGARFDATCVRLSKLSISISNAKQDQEKRIKKRNAASDDEKKYFGVKGDISEFKLRIARLKARGDISAAVEALVLLTDTIPDDAESWLELSDMYTSLHMFQQALHCAEEVVLLVPVNHLAHAHVARIYAAIDNTQAHKSIGGNRNSDDDDDDANHSDDNDVESSDALRRCVQYYCRSVELCPRFVLGMYGVIRAAREFLARREGRGTGTRMRRSTAAACADVAAAHDACVAALKREYACAHDDGDDNDNDNVDGGSVSRRAATRYLDAWHRDVTPAQRPSAKKRQ